MKKIFGSCLASFCVLASAMAATPTTQPTHTLRSVSSVGTLSGAEQVSSNLGFADGCWWDNGSSDGRNGLQSQTLGNFNFRVADDYILESGRWHLITSIKVCMAVSANVATPNVELEVYEDCNGKPGNLRTTLLEPTATEIGQSPFAGFKLYEFEFSLNEFNLGDLSGCDRVWLSPFGRGTGAYFWVTSNNGVVQGVQGQFFAPTLGYPTWTDGEDVVNFRICSDFCFSVCGKVCYTIKDQCDYDLAGLSSIKFPNIDIQDARAADNFQISSAEEAVGICRIEAYLATNCDPTRVFAEIYANDCDEPSALLYTLREPEVIIQDGVFFDGLQVYCFRFTCPTDVVLQGGNNYWFSLAATSGGTIFDRAVFLFKRRNVDCKDIHITQAVYRNPFAGFEEFVPVEDAADGVGPREFAFCIYGYVIPTVAGGTDRPLDGDANTDGFVNFQDIVSVLRNWAFTNPGNGGL